MDRSIEKFFAALRHKKVAMLGLGVSHLELTLLLRRKGIDVTACDRRSLEALGDTGRTLAEAGVSLRLGDGYLEGLEQFDVIFRTPGMNFHMAALQRAMAAGRAVTSEMEVFFDLCPCPVIAVTGSDGKTTTTTLIAEMLKAQGRTVHLGGNIGRALLPIIEEIRPEDVAVVELSSFQLISMRQSPQIAVVTNVAPNHLDVHKDMAEYIAAKENILLHQNAFSRTVLNADNDITRAMAQQVRGELLTFSRRQRPARGTFLDEEGRLCFVDGEACIPLLHRSEIRIPGIHNVENFLAAIAAVHGLVEPEQIRRVAREFAGVEHRIEFVRELDGVRWYNDSIATSPTRTMAGLNSFSEKLIVIAGGYDKKIPFEPLAPALIQRTRAVILTGPTAGKIRAAVEQCEGYTPGCPELIDAKDLADAVAIARRIARPGDVVSLSPACASFDAYPNFEARGRHFKQLVKDL